MKRALGMLCIGAGLASCGPSQSPLTVEVRDAATHQPAAGVTVVADVPGKYHPFAIASILGQTGPDGSKSTTDDRGRATVQYIPGRPVRLGIFQPGWDAGFVLIDPDAVGFSTETWYSSPDLPKVEPHQPEYRVEKK